MPLQKYIPTSITRLIIITLVLQLVPACSSCNNPNTDNSHSQPFNQPNTPHLENQLLPLQLKDIQFDQTTEHVTCTVENSNKTTVKDIAIHWTSKTNGARIMQGSKLIQEISIGKLDTEKEQANQVVGKLHFGSNPSASFTFWVTAAGDTTHHSEQPIEFHNSWPVSLRLIPVGSTQLQTHAHRVFKVKIAQGKGGTIDAEKVKLEIRQLNSNSSARILYNNQAVTSLIGTNLSGSMVNVLEFVVDPSTEKHVAFFVQLLYDKKEQGKIGFDWYQQNAQDAFEAISRGNLKIFQETLDLTKINNNDLAKKDLGVGDTLLTRVIRSLNESTGLPYVNLLLEKGADTNKPNSETGLTPLHYAIIDNKETIVDRLLKDDKMDLFTLSTSSKWRYSPFHAAATKDTTTIMHGLLDKLQREAKNEKQIAHLLNIKETQARGETPLFLAASVRNGGDNFKLLLKHGADPNILDTQNNSPLYRIIHNRDIEKAEALLQVSKLRINQQNKEGDTPLHIAAWTGKVEMVQLLLKNGAKTSINVKNKEGFIPAGYLSGGRGNSNHMSEADKEAMRKLLNLPTI